MGPFWRLAVFACGALLLTAGASESSGRLSRPSAVFPAGDPARGARIAQTCVVCHDSEAMTFGQPPTHIPRLLHQRPTSVFYALQDYKTGRRRSDLMRPVAAALSDQDMRDVAVYLGEATTGIPKLQLGDTPNYALAKSRCMVCHGETGMGEIEGSPVIAGQERSYIEYALGQYRSGARAETTMRAVASRLTRDQIGLLAAYFSAQGSLGRGR